MTLDWDNTFCNAIKRLQKPSATLAFNQQVNALKKGYPIINLSVGEPDFQTPLSIQKAGIKAIEEGKTRYTAVDGIAPLKDAIIQKLKDDNQLSYLPEEIMVGTGAKQLIFNALLATLEPGDEVIVFAPYWVSYIDIIQFCGATPVIVETSIEDDFTINPKKLAQSLNERTKWIILNSPSNPTGRVYNEEELRSIVTVLRSYPNVLVMSDDIYEYLIFDEDSHFTNVAMLGDDLRKRTLVINGVSKGFSMTGWRIGYGAGPIPLIKAMTNLQSQSTSNPCTISQYAALEALTTKRDEFLPDWLGSYKKNRDLAYNRMKNISILDVNKPNGAFYLLVGCKKCMGLQLPDGKTIDHPDDVSYYLLHEAQVGVVPGSAFGYDHSFRLSYAVDHDMLQDALSRIEKAFDRISH